MKPTAAWGHMLFAGGLTAMGLLAPWPLVASLAVACWATLGFRRSFLTFAALTLAIDAAMLAWLSAVALDGLRLGLIGGTRIIAVVGVNWAIFGTLSMPRLVDGLRLPRGMTAFVGAVMLAGHDLAQDFERMTLARRLDGDWPDTRRKKVAAAARLLPGLLVSAWQRGLRRQEALRSAGLGVGPHFAPIVAVTALAIAGRLAFIAIPNVALTYAVVFTGGVAFGARVGAWSGLWAMVLSNLVITGLAPSPYVNAPAMALIGATGGMFRKPRAGDAVSAALLGFVATMVFSAITDTLSWLLIPEYRTSVALLQVRVAAGLVFNVLPALTNAWLFAAALRPVQRAFAAFDQSRRSIA